MERRYDSHLAAYAYGPFGPISRTILDADPPLNPILPCGTPADLPIRDVAGDPGPPEHPHRNA